ncbi:MAG TPA: hypothetical protein VKX49_18340 [Bryobacteraceae bacterium]|nr:hypothetical protein [Bryobacteraceae bacterium]
METVHFGRALYYPHIFPESRLWLRTAALYHDRIGRIVPAGFVPTAYDRHSGPELLNDFNALQAAGFIEDRHPDGVRQDVGEQFISFIAPLLKGPNTKAALTARLRSRDWKPYNMYREKIEPGLLDLLEPEGLTRNVNDYEVEFDGSIGGLYMVFLARQLARHYPIVSDDPMYEMLMHVPLEGESTPAPVDHGLLLATAVFSSAVPIDIESVDIKDLINFRNEFEGERQAFYDWIGAFRSDLGKISDSKQLAEAVEHHKANVERRMVALKRKFALLNLKNGSGIFTFSMPGLVMEAYASAHHNPAVIIGGGALVLAGIAGNAVLERWLTKADAPVSYVHSMRKELKPKQYAGKLIELKLSSI